MISMPIFSPCSMAMFFCSRRWGCTTGTVPKRRCSIPINQKSSLATIKRARRFHGKTQGVHQEVPKTGGWGNKRHIETSSRTIIRLYHKYQGFRAFETWAVKKGRGVVPQILAGHFSEEDCSCLWGRGGVHCRYGTTRRWHLCARWGWPLL